jgi:predicted pyridoxine 5'-phosphate oxidase superfamily flavin-nucleotide-binding protein
VISTEAAKLLEAGSLVVGTADADAVPDASRGWGAWTLDGGRRLRLLVPATDLRTVANLRSDGRVAVNVSHVRTLKSAQVKGRATLVERPTPADLELHRHYVDRFFAAVHEADGTPLERLSGMMPRGLIATELHVEAVFDATPGPTAGQVVA